MKVLNEKIGRGDLVSDMEERIKKTEELKLKLLSDWEIQYRIANCKDPEEAKLLQVEQLRRKAFRVIK